VEDRHPSLSQPTITFVSSDWDALAELAVVQDQVVSRPQLYRLGVQRWQVRRRTRRGTWQPLGPRAVVLHAGPPTKVQRWWCALINTCPHAVLAGATALEASGLKGYESDTVHVAVPKGSRPLRRSGVTVHESRRLEGSDVHPARRPPQVRPDVAVVQAALWAPDPARACAVLAAAVQQRLVQVSQLSAQMLRVRRHRHRKLILLVLADIGGGAQSLAEIDFAHLCRAAGLPVPTRQRVRRDRAGRRRYLDVEWEEFALVVEIDGMLHMQVGRWIDDAFRGNDVTLDRRVVLRFPALAVRLHGDRVLDQVRLGLLNAGWQPSGERRRRAS